MKKALFFIIPIVVIVVLITGVIFYNKDYNLDYTLVYYETCDNTDDNTYWFSLRDEKYNGFFTEEYLRNYGVKFSDFDYENYTYIVTFGHELKGITYSPKKTKNRVMFVFPKQYIGKVVLCKENTGKVYIYRVKKMDIDCDYHERDKNVSFE
ncbi:MAG: hypothetical protein J5992_08545 [Oscillospiraceae bacterium]|nr:hypothetical protein [Oscillospiraceae bacterium]